MKTAIKVTLIKVGLTLNGALCIQFWKVRIHFFSMFATLLGDLKYIETGRAQYTARFVRANWFKLIQVIEVDLDYLSEREIDYLGAAMGLTIALNILAGLGLLWG